MLLDLNARSFKADEARLKKKRSPIMAGEYQRYRVRRHHQRVSRCGAVVITPRLGGNPDCRTSRPARSSGALDSDIQEADPYGHYVPRSLFACDKCRRNRRIVDELTTRHAAQNVW